MKTKVYILGAGASKDDGVPLMEEFITESLRQWHGDDDIIRRLFEFVQRTFGRNVQVTDELPNQAMFETARFLDNDKEIGIEGLLAAAIKREEREAKIAIEDFIYKTIEKKSYQCKYLRNFVTNKIKRDIQSGFNIVILSFNYDTLLERALLFNSMNKKFSYLISSFEDLNNRGNHYMKEYKGKIKFLKPHGSLNWALCNKCKNIQHHWSRRYKSYDNNSCNKCGQKELTHLLVAPVKNKINGDIFGPLWREAEKSLKKANEIIVIGYSFRETDKKAREKIGKAIANNLNYPMLTIVDNDPIKICNAILEISGKNKSRFSKVCFFYGFKQFLKD